MAVVQMIAALEFIVSVREPAAVAGGRQGFRYLDFLASHAEIAQLRVNN